MSLIHVAHHGTSLGSFDFKEIAAGIASKRFAAEDLVWREGMKRIGDHYVKCCRFGDWSFFCQELRSQLVGQLLKA
jgi:hypothetical protein